MTSIDKYRWDISTYAYDPDISTCAPIKAGGLICGVIGYGILLHKSPNYHTLLIIHDSYIINFS